MSLAREARAESQLSPSLLESPGLSLSFGGSDESSERDRSASRASESGAFRPLSLTLNPITLLLNRFGGNVELLPGQHHAISANPFYQVATEDSDTVTKSFRAFGAEVGYRYYSGRDGAEGFFAGPSFILMRGDVTAACRASGCRLSPDLDTTTYGMSVDAGYQWMTAGGLTIGGGVGAMYLRSDTGTRGSGALRFEGVLPRLLFSVGYST